MKLKSLGLLLVFCLGLAPTAKVSTRDRSDSTSLFYASRSILLEEEDLEVGFRPSGGMLAVSPLAAGTANGDALGNLIQATKDQRNNLNDSCRQLKMAYRTDGHSCEIEVLDNYCSAQEDKLNQRISFLRKLRGDQRKLFTRLWHNVKRSGDRIWSGVGPVGRRILRRVGPEVAEVVLSGGSLSGGVLRKILIKEVRHLGKAELDRVLEQGLNRFFQGQAALAQAAGVKDCTPEKMIEARRRMQGELDVPAEVGVSKPLDGDQSEEVDLSVDGPGEGGCPEGNWFQDYWESTIWPDLIAEGRNCQRTAVNKYRACLQDQAIQEVCPLDALAVCEELYQAIPANDGGEMVSLSPSIIHSEAEQEATSLSYPSAGGPVSGSFNYMLRDMHVCTITVNSTLQGTYDPATCSMSGTAQMSFTYEGKACASVCGSGPESETACPVTRSGSPGWEATLENGVLSGRMGNDACQPGCIGFQVGP